MSLPASISALAGRQEAIAGQLVAWAEINSGSDHPEGLERMRHALSAALAARLPGTVEAVSLPGTGARALRLSVRPDAPVQVLCSGHYDTVYGASHAFQRCERLDAARLRGPGVADMKGGILLMVEALQAFEANAEATAGWSATPGRAASNRANLGWEILLTPDEETGSTASRALLAATAPRFDLALIFEPARANGNAVRRRMGTAIFTVTCHGRAAHAGRDPAQGRNAVVALAALLPQIDELNREMSGILVNVGTVRGGSAVNMVPDLAVAEINVRAAGAAEATAVEARLRDLVAPLNGREGYRVELSGQFNRPPKDVSPVEEAWFAQWQRCATEVGCTLNWEDVGGGSDGNLLGPAGVACLDGIGPIGDGLHSPTETVDLPSLVQRAQAAALFLYRLSHSGGARPGAL